MNNNRQKILIVDDDDSIRWVLCELLQDIGYKITQTSSAEHALEQIKNQTFDCLISDVRMSGKSGMELLDYCRANHADLPVIIMTAHSDLDSAVQAYQQGAFEYLPKPFDLDEVSSTVERAIVSRRKIEPIQEDSQDNKYAIVGESPAMQDLYRAIGRLSNSQVSVLLHGESGTGKELVAKALHQHSPRKNMPFIALNMAAIPRDLIESELFGHEKGAFTGATGRWVGRFAQADGGTLFLDEIGDMPLEAQTRLLRVLSESAFYRIGAVQPTQVNVRIIAATHQNLLNKVEKGEFREDLYHRLNVIPINLPPLRERITDLPLLAKFFFERIAKELNEPKKTLQASAVSRMQSYHWPGNVRQLENVCRWLSVMANSQSISENDLPNDILGIQEKSKTANNWQQHLSMSLQNLFQQGDQKVFIQAQRDFEALIMQSALTATNGKKAEASNLLGWGRNTLTRKLNNLK